MSSYLNIYGVLKEDDRKICIVSYSRSCPIYQTLYENLHIEWAGNEDRYTELTTEKVNAVLSEVKNQISNLEKRINEYEKHANGNMDVINEILNSREYLEELISTREYLYFINDIIDNVNYSDTLKGIVCNIS